MSAVRMLAGSDIRRRWRSVVALTLLVGFIGAIVLATAAGARRSDAALSRFNAWSRSSDVEISIGFPTARELDAFRRTPGVSEFAVVHGYSLSVLDNFNLAIAAPVDSAMGNVVDRARLIEGRRPDPAVPEEVTVGESLVAQMHLRIGSYLATTSYTQDQITTGFTGGDPGPPAGAKVRFRVVGIVRRPLDLGVRAQAGGVVLLTPAFNEKYASRVGLYTDVLRVKTVRGAADVPDVVARARQLWGTDGTFGVQGLGIETEGAHSAIDVLTLVLWIFAGVTLLAGVVAIAIVMTHDIARATTEQSTLRSLGATRGQRVAASGARALLVAAGGSLLAGVLALSMSPLFPVGLARRADPDVGFHADWMVVAVGVALVALVVLAVALLAAWRATRTPSPDRVARSRRRTSPLVETAARAGLAPTATNGLRMALHAGSGETSVPVRSAFAGAVFGIAGITAVMVFSASLSHLVATPRLTGWNWDVKVEVPTKATQDAKCVDSNTFGLAREQAVDALAALCLDNVEVDGRPVTVWGFESLRGAIPPSLVAGRAPSAPAEIALGTATLRAIHKHIGDKVKARGTNGTREYVVVGRVAFPTVAEPQPLADGAAMTASGLRPIIEKGANETHYLLIRFAPGADRSGVERRLAGNERLFQNRSGATTPVEVSRLQQINRFPAILAGLLTILALVAVGHAVVTSVLRRRREIALLKTVGFNRRQVSATFAWQSTTLAVIGFVVGIPIGLLAGRLVWKLVADSLGVATGATMPAPALVLIAAGAVVLCNLIAFVPGRAAARTRPAVALRSE